jgi:hypothetical protein
MTPKIPLPTDRLTGLGIPDTSAWSRAIGTAGGRIHRETNQLSTVDPVTMELVRMRNARHQQCRL